MYFFSADDDISHCSFEWAISYMTTECDSKTTVDKIKKNIKGPIFGCSSAYGVFTPNSFKRGAFFLAAGKEDNIKVYPVIKMCMEKTAFNCAKIASREIKEKFGTPDLILMHATPGFEEKILDGVIEIFGNNVPICGGSASEDNSNNNCFVFKDTLKLREGFLLVGIKCDNVYNNFISKYTPTNFTGLITKANSRTVYEIDNKPAAIVYNEWTKGLIDKYINTGGIIFHSTTLYPIGRLIEEEDNNKIFLLSHPYMVIPKNNGITFFTEFKEGDRIWLLYENKDALIDNVKIVAQNSLTENSYNAIKGTILIYCKGLLNIIKDKADLIVENYKSVIKNNNFIGIASTGEQGFFKGNINKSFHGNLMINTIIF